jgi:hypothetical protein
MLKKIIDRPVLATVISLIIVILGIIGLNQLAVTRFPIFLRLPLRFQDLIREETVKR